MNWDAIGAIVASAISLLAPLSSSRGDSTEGPAPQVSGHSCESSSDWPVVQWRTLSRGRYRAALKAGVLDPGIAGERPLDCHWPTIVFVHGAEGAPSQFAALGDALGDCVNATVFLYDDLDRLAATAEVLRNGLLRLPGTTIVVGHSMGTLLPGYVAATDADDRLRHVGAVYLNPLIGGSRHADDIVALRWLRPLKPFIQRVFFRPRVRDLAPESDFEQAIFGKESHAPSIAARTVVLFTERAGQEPDIQPDRVPQFFGRTRAQLLDRMGVVAGVEAKERRGHQAPLVDTRLVLPLISDVLERTAGHWEH